jgi:hypothetical protein
MATHRLPTPGSDNGTWGDILNDFLVQAHNADGSLQDGIITDAKISSSAAIAKTKLASAVQTSLTAADNATPKPASGVNGKPVQWNNTSGQLEDATTSLNATYVPQTQLGVALGVATLDSSSVVVQNPKLHAARHNVGAADDISSYFLDKTRLNLRSVLEYGAVADMYQPGTTITLTTGSPTATMGAVPTPAPKAGQTLITDTAGNYIIQSVAGTTVTFTTNASASGAMQFFYGTDSTTAFNNMFSDALTNKKAMYVPSGRYLITNTIGILEPGNSLGAMGMTIIWGGGGGTYVGRQSQMNQFSGTALVWGGATGGTMMQLSRVLFAKFMGTVTFVLQSSYDNSGVFTFFGPKAGLGLHLSQNSTPLVGTGYMTLDDIIFEGGSQAMQFGTNLADNNCDTSIINRLVLWHCDNGIRVKNSQGLGYRINWMQAATVPGYVIKTDDGGAIDVGSMHLNHCGTATTDPTVDTYCLDFASNINGYLFKIGLLRIENGTTRVAAIRNGPVQLQINTFEEAQTAIDDTLFYQLGGVLQILGGRIASSKVSGRVTFYMRNDGSSKAAQLIVLDTSLPTQDRSKLLNYDANTVADVSFVRTRDDNHVVYPDYYSRFERGGVYLGGASADATTAIQLDPMNRLGGSAYNYSYGPRVPKGTSVVDVTVVGDHGDGTQSIFARRLVLYRNAGNGVVVSTSTVGSDAIAGTDQIFSITVSATYNVLNIQIKGTASTTVNWRAKCILVTTDVGILTPDF